MGAPAETEAPPIMAAVKGHGLTWYDATDAEPSDFEPPKPEDWAEPPPWLVSPQKSFPDGCAPFGESHAPDVICCGAMIKYYACAAGRVAGFVQYEEELKSWDHACGLICVQESGGAATDAEGARVLFPDRLFNVKGGVVCSSAGRRPSTRTRCWRRRSGINMMGVWVGVAHAVRHQRPSRKECARTCARVRERASASVGFDPSR